MSNPQLLRGGANLSAVLFALSEGDEEQQATLQRITEVVRQIPEEPFIKIGFADTSLGDVMAGFVPDERQETSGGRLIDARLLSDGTMRMLAIVTALETVPDSSRIVIEEFDNGLHPSRAKLLVRTLSETASRRKLNVLVTTHNPAFMDALDESQMDSILICHGDESGEGSRVTKLDGESHRSPNCFSNRMPRTISTKPDYSVRWWRRNGYIPPPRDVFEILERMIEYRFRSCPPNRTGSVIESDARRLGDVLPRLKGCVTDVITSPPYLDTTNYREDQWLRLWFLGCMPITTYSRADDRHYNKEMYWEFLQASWRGLAPLLAEQVRLVVRIGGRRLNKPELRKGLVRSLEAGLSRSVRLVDTGISSRICNTQANAFRGVKASQLTEHDFAFIV